MIVGFTAETGVQDKTPCSHTDISHFSPIKESLRLGTTQGTAFFLQRQVETRDWSDTD